MNGVLAHIKILVNPPKTSKAKPQVRIKQSNLDASKLVKFKHLRLTSKDMS